MLTTPSTTWNARFAVGLAVCAFVALAACESPAPPSDADEVWRFAIEETAGSLQDAYAQRFRELVEERTGGEVEVLVYTYGTLGTSDHITEQLNMGTIQFAMASPGHLGKLMPEVQAFLLHFTMSDDPAVNHRALRDDEPLRRLMSELYAEKGMHYVTAFGEGEMAWTTKQPVRSPDDFAGVRMRVMTSPLLLASYAAYGANPTPLPYAEVYSGLQLNMIDGQVNPIFAIQEMSFYEVTDYLIFPGHAHFFTTLTANPDFWDGLSDERRAMLEQIFEELQEFIFETEQRFNEERLDIIREARPELEILRLSDEEQAAFRERAVEVRERYLELAGPRGAELLATIEAAVERASAAEAAD